MFQVRLVKQLPSLRQLSLSGNPCADHPDYLRALADSCRSLTLMDGVPLKTLLQSSSDTTKPTRHPLAQLSPPQPSNETPPPAISQHTCQQAMPHPPRQDSQTITADHFPHANPIRPVSPTLSTGCREGRQQDLHEAERIGHDVAVNTDHPSAIAQYTCQPPMPNSARLDPRTITAGNDTHHNPTGQTIHSCHDIAVNTEIDSKAIEANAKLRAEIVRLKSALSEAEATSERQR
eukprot:scaffold334386_cov40-Prasinocladus_malaysianus.AAC.1